jgi:hypothetical protein
VIATLDELRFGAYCGTGHKGPVKQQPVTIDVDNSEPDTSLRPSAEPQSPINILGCDHSVQSHSVVVKIDFDKFAHGGETDC